MLQSTLFKILLIVITFIVSTIVSPPTIFRIPEDLLQRVIKNADVISMTQLVLSKTELSSAAKKALDETIDDAIVKTANAKTGFDEFITSPTYTEGFIKMYSDSTFYQFKAKYSKELYENIAESLKKTKPENAHLITKATIFHPQVMFTACMDPKLLKEKRPRWIAALGVKWYEPKLEILEEDTFKAHGQLTRVCSSIYNQVKFKTPFELNLAFRFVAKGLKTLCIKLREGKELDEMDKIFMGHLRRTLLFLTKSSLFAKAFQGSTQIKIILFQQQLQTFSVGMVRQFPNDDHLLKVKPFTILPSEVILKDGINLYKEAKLSFTFEDLWRVILFGGAKEFIQEAKKELKWEVEDKQIDVLIKNLEYRETQEDFTQFLTGLKTKETKSS